MRSPSTAGRRWRDPPGLIARHGAPDAVAFGALSSLGSGAFGAVSAAIAGARAVDDPTADSAPRGPPFEEVDPDAVGEHKGSRERREGKCQYELSRHGSHP